jgi:hypothetical protein
VGISFHGWDSFSMPLRHLIMHCFGGLGGGSILWCTVVAKVAIGADEDLAKFGYILNKKIKFLYILV